MKRKIVVKVSMTCDECRSKALQTVSKIKGLISVGIEGPENDRVVVVGEDIDTVLLLDKLRKNVGDADIVTVQEIRPPFPPVRRDQDNVVVNQPVVPQYPPPYPPYSYLWYPVRDADPSCIIL